VDIQKRHTIWRVYSRRNKKGLLESRLAEIESRGGWEIMREKGNTIRRENNRGPVVGNHSLLGIGKEYLL